MQVYLSIILPEELVGKKFVFLLNLQKAHVGGFGVSVHDFSG